MRVQAGIEVIGVCDARERRIRRHVARAGDELAGRRGGGVERILADVVRLALEVQLEPVLVEGQRPVVVADRAEAVDVASTHAAPVDELDAELEGAAHRADEFDFVDLQRVVERAQVRHGRLAHADRADVFGLDELDGALALERVREAGGRHPAGGPASHDHDAF